MEEETDVLRLLKNGKKNEFIGRSGLSEGLAESVDAKT